METQLDCNISRRSGLKRGMKLQVSEEGLLVRSGMNELSVEIAKRVRMADELRAVERVWQLLGR